MTDFQLNITPNDLISDLLYSVMIESVGSRLLEVEVRMPI